MSSSQLKVMNSWGDTLLSEAAAVPDRLVTIGSYATLYEANLVKAEPNGKVDLPALTGGLWNRRAPKGRIYGKR